MRTVVALGVALTVLGLGGAARAAVHVVTDLGDTGAPGQLRWLMNSALAGDTILIPPGTIFLTGVPGEDANGSGDLDVDTTLTIVGSGAELTILDAGHLDRVLEVRASGDLVLSGVTLRNGRVDPETGFGGGAVRNDGRLMLVSSIVEDSSSGAGGGIFNHGSLVVEGTTIRNNSASGTTGAGGGLINFDKMTLSHSAVVGNLTLGPSASGNGGGISNVSAMEIVNTTISGNEAFGHGGGIFQASSASFLLMGNVTIASNAARFFGGGLEVMGAIPSIGNTILGTNKSGLGRSGADCHGTIDSEGHNLIAVAAGCTISGVTTGNILGRNPRLRPLADNGGPTLTHGLRAASRAIDAGSPSACPAIDQRGVARPQDGDGDGVAVCDIGAFERAR